MLSFVLEEKTIVFFIIIKQAPNPIVRIIMPFVVLILIEFPQLKFQFFLSKLEILSEIDAAYHFVFNEFFGNSGF